MTEQKTEKSVFQLFMDGLREKMETGGQLALLVGITTNEGNTDSILFQQQTANPTLLVGELEKLKLQILLRKPDASDISTQ